MIYSDKSYTERSSRVSETLTDVVAWKFTHHSHGLSALETTIYQASEMHENFMNVSVCILANKKVYT
jgi:hypothetical protein